MPASRLPSNARHMLSLKDSRPSNGRIRRRNGDTQMNESAAEKAFKNRTRGYSAHGLMMEIPGNHAFLAD
jgi:hypothetical protein